MNKRTIICLFPNERIRKIEGFRQKYINHPGKDVPFHITLLTNFYTKEQFNEEINKKLYEVIKKIEVFSFEAVPISTFPTTNVIYLTPVPSAPFENITNALYEAFPLFSNNKELPIFHMTIAYNYPNNIKEKIISKFMDKFGNKRIKLTAGRIGICIQEDSGWKEYLSYKIGE